MAFLSGCQSPGNESSIDRPDPTTAPLNETLSQSSDKDFLDIQPQLAEISALIASYRVSAATYAIDKLRQSVPRDSLSPQHSYDLAILEVKLAKFNDPARANTLIDEISPENPPQERTLRHLRAEIHALRGDFQQSIRTLLDSRFEDDPSQQDLIWNIVRMTPREQQNSNLTSAESSDERAWWELGLIDSTALSLNGRKAQIEEWRSTQESSVLNALPVDQFVPRSPQPQHIALLLPQTGPLAAPALEIRNGFIHAQFRESHVNEKMRITVFDTEEKPIQDVVSEAIEEGVDTIVGPLDKERLRELTELRNLEVPVVALNRVDLTNRNTNLYQLGLDVEDDAVAISQLLNAQGMNRVILMQGATSWATRAAMTFINAAGPEIEIVGEVVLSNLGEITEAVSDVLHVTNSNERFDAIKQISLNEIEFVARRRQDVDGIVAFLGKAEFEILSAALEYHFAADVKLFVTAPSIRELLNSVNRNEGIHFTISPVFTEQSSLFDEIKKATNLSADAISLHALGCDAYRIVNHLELLRRGIALRGATGRISLGSNGILLRRPSLHSVKEGEIISVFVSIPFAKLGTPST